jgi:FMN reductase
LLKLFVDQLPRAALDGVVAVPVMTAANPAHRPVVDTHLAPLLVEVGARVPVRGLCVLEAEFSRLERAVSAWAVAAVPDLAAALTGRDADPSRPVGLDTGVPLGTR